MNGLTPVAPMPLKPVPETQRTDYLPTRREEDEGRRHHHDQQPSHQHQGQPDQSEQLPDGTFLDSLDSLEPIFDRYRHRIPHYAPYLTPDQRQLLGALYATAAHRGYGLSRIDAIAQRFASETSSYAERTVVNPLAVSGLIIDTQA